MSIKHRINKLLETMPKPKHLFIVPFRPVLVIGDDNKPTVIFPPGMTIAGLEAMEFNRPLRPLIIAGLPIDVLEDDCRGNDEY